LLFAILGEDEGKGMRKKRRPFGLNSQRGVSSMLQILTNKQHIPANITFENINSGVVESQISI